MAPLISGTICRGLTTLYKMTEMFDPYREDPMFMIGDLVYFERYWQGPNGLRLGLVVKVAYNLGIRCDPLYEVFWFSRGYNIVHSGNQLRLVYEKDRTTGDVKINVCP